MSNADDKRRAPLPAFRPGPRLEAELDARGEGVQMVRESLANYFDALGEELKSVDLDEQEALLICDALAGRFATRPLELVWFLCSRVDEEISRRDLASRYAVNPMRLVAKLRILTYTQRLAIIDACLRVSRGGTVYSTGLVRQVREQQHPG